MIMIMVIPLYLLPECLVSFDPAARGTTGGFHSESSRVLPPFARSFLHVDDSKIEQFLRDVVTNAVNNMSPTYLCSNQNMIQ